MLTSGALARVVPCIWLAGCLAHEGSQGSQASQGSGQPGAAQRDPGRARQRFIDLGVQGSFVVLTPSVPGDPTSPPRAWVVEHGDQATRRTVPASTFKIPNTLIGLSTGAVTEDTQFTWDRAPRRVKAWERDLSLKDAFRVSCVPCYQQLARRVGLERMREAVRSLGYGDAVVGDAVDTFWLVGPLTISVEEEAAFVRRLYLGQLPFDAASLAFVRDAMQLEETADHRLFGKTGWADHLQPNVGWFVGWVEVSGQPSFFALRVLVSEEQRELMALRKQLALELLRDLGVTR